MDIARNVISIVDQHSVLSHPFLA